MKPTAKRHIGNLIKQQRIKKNLSQQDLAVMIGVDRQYIWNIENGRVNISLDYLDNIIKELKCSHCDFFQPINNLK